MHVSDQIIAVFNDLCAKLGIAIDWTAENIFPYVEDLCKRYIKYEICTSIAWCLIMIVVTAILFYTAVLFHRQARKVRYDEDEFCSLAAIISWVIFGVMSLLTIIVCGNKVFYIIKCCTIPEKVILEYINSLILSATNG